MKVRKGIVYFEMYREAREFGEMHTKGWPAWRVVDYMVGFAVQLRPGGDYLGPNGKPSLVPALCPVCGKKVTLKDDTRDGRVVGSCGDAFTLEAWLAPDDDDADGALDACIECGCPYPRHHSNCCAVD